MAERHIPAPAFSWFTFLPVYAQADGRYYDVLLPAAFSVCNTMGRAGNMNVSTCYPGVVPTTSVTAFLPTDYTPPLSVLFLLQQRMGRPIHSRMYVT